MMKSHLVVLLLFFAEGCSLGDDRAAIQKFQIDHYEEGEVEGFAQLDLRQKPGGWNIGLDVAPKIYRHLETSRSIHADMYVVNCGETDLNVGVSLLGFEFKALVEPGAQATFYSGELKEFLQYGMSVNMLHVSAKAHSAINARLFIRTESEKNFLKYITVRPFITHASW